MEKEVMVLEGVVLLPKSVVPLNIFEPRYKQMLQQSLEGSRRFVLGNVIQGHPARFVGEGLIRSSIQNGDGTYQLMLEGVDRLRINRVLTTEPLLRVDCEPVATIPRKSEDDSLRVKIESIVRGIENTYPETRVQLAAVFDENLDDTDFCDLVAGMLVADATIKQRVLEIESVEKRLTLLHDFLDTARLT